MQHPKDVGDRTALAIMLALQACGFSISIPFGENTRYDLVIDDGDQLARVQCKTGRLRGGAVRFATCSTYGHHRQAAMVRRSYQGQVDYFAVYCPETDGVYLVPIADVSTRSQAALRVDWPKNNQARGIRHAKTYEVAGVHQEVIRASATGAG